VVGGVTAQPCKKGDELYQLHTNNDMNAKGQYAQECQHLRRK